MNATRILHAHSIGGRGLAVERGQSTGGQTRSLDPDERPAPSPGYVVAVRAAERILRSS